MIVVFTGALTANMPVAFASTSVGLHGAHGQKDVLLPPPLIQMASLLFHKNTFIWDVSTGHLPLVTQAYANYAMDPLPLISLLLEFSLPLIFYVGVTVFTFYSQVPMWLQLTLIGSQPFGLH